MSLVKTVLSMIVGVAHAESSSFQAVCFIQQLSAKVPPKRSQNAAAMQQDDDNVAKHPPANVVKIDNIVDSAMANQQSLVRKMNSEIKALEQKRVQSNTKLHASFEKQLKDQDHINKALKKFNEKTTNEIKLLQQQNGDLKKKIGNISKNSDNLIEKLHERKSNLTAALAFTMSSEEKIVGAMHNTTALGVLDEFRARAEAPARSQIAESLFQQGEDAVQSVEADEDDMKLANMMADFSKGQEEYAAVLKEKFESKFKVGTALHEALLKEQVQLTETKAAETTLRSKLTDVLKDMTEAHKSFEKELNSLSSFAKGFKGAPMQAQLLSHAVDPAKYNSLRALAMSMASTKEEPDTQRKGVFSFWR